MSRVLPAAVDATLEEGWRPRLFECSDARERAEVAALRSADAVAFVHDTLLGQLGELVAARHPQRKLRDEERDALVRLHLGGTSPSDYGVWVYYPWARRLVHVLPVAEFREVRSSRNRNKITREEQAHLASLAVGVVGLSVGRATAVTLALEGVAGQLRLADFDRLELSNLNRLRAPIHDLGVNKAVSTAREIFEIDPFIDILIYPQGITTDAIDSFLLEPRPMDFLIEECDDLEMKVRLREHARRHRIPVLMETSDRGMIDVERFDKEPDRPLFHGLVEGLDADLLHGLDTYRKVPIVLQIIGAATMSRRLAASLVDVETTIETWPQLASAVALGGALNTDTLRRIALGQLHASGRYWVDLEGLVRWPATPERAPLTDEPLRADSEAEALPELSIHAHWADTAHALVSRGVLAPSGGNVQPWRFEAREGIVECHLDSTTPTTLLDFRHRASLLACGAAGANVELAAASIGLALEMDWTPNPSRPTLVWAACSRGRVEPRVDPLTEWIPRRVTNRRLSARVPLDPEHARILAEDAEQAGASIRMLTSASELDAAAELLAEGERIRMTTERLHREMMSELRWTRAEAERTRDGIELDTLELDATQRAGLEVMRQWSVMQMLRDLDAGRGLGRGTRKAIAAASAVGLLVWPRRDPEAYGRGGRALQRIWLRATALGLAFQPMSSLVYLLARFDEGGAGLGTDDVDRLAPLARGYERLFGRRDTRADLLLFRLAAANPPSARSLRRPVAAVLRVDGCDPS